MVKWTTAAKIIEHEALKATQVLTQRREELVKKLEQEIIINKGLKVRFDYLRKITGVDYELEYEKDSYAALYINDGLNSSGLVDKVEQIGRQVEISLSELDGCDNSTWAIDIADSFRSKMAQILES
jgi:hypothetical protein